MASRAEPTLNLPRSPPQGNCLLVGVGGSGKQSLSRLAAFTAGCDVFEITLTRGYDEAAFREDLKRLYGMLGSENKRIMFLFTDAHVADEGFLELINNMLTSGMVPALYDGGEKDGLISSVRAEVCAAAYRTRSGIRAVSLSAYQRPFPSRRWRRRACWRLRSHAGLTTWRSAATTCT